MRTIVDNTFCNAVAKCLFEKPYVGTQQIRIVTQRQTFCDALIFFFRKYMGSNGISKSGNQYYFRSGRCTDPDIVIVDPQWPLTASLNEPAFNYSARGECYYHLSMSNYKACEAKFVEQWNKAYPTVS